MRNREERKHNDTCFMLLLDACFDPVRSHSSSVLNVLCKGAIAAWVPETGEDVNLCEGRDGYPLLLLGWTTWLCSLSIALMYVLFDTDHQCYTVIFI